MKKQLWLVVVGLVIISIIIFGLIFWYVLYPVKHRMIIEKYSEIYALPPELICSVINTESNFNKTAESKVGAKGLMQLMPNTAQEIANKLQVKNYTDEMLFSPDINIRFGCYYLSYLLNMYNGNLVNTVAAYNAGFNKVNLWLNSLEYSVNGEVINPPIAETKNYISKILTALKVYKVRY